MFVFLGVLYNVSVPVAFEIVKKPIKFIDSNTGQTKRKSAITKNELMRDMIQTAINNQLKFSYILMDTWFASKENFEFIAKKNKHFIAALKSNRLFATNLKNKYQGDLQKVDTLELSDKQSIRGQLIKRQAFIVSCFLLILPFVFLIFFIVYCSYGKNRRSKRKNKYFKR